MSFFNITRGNEGGTETASPNDVERTAWQELADSFAARVVFEEARDRPLDEASSKLFWVLTFIAGRGGVHKFRGVREWNRRNQDLRVIGPS